LTCIQGFRNFIIMDRVILYQYQTPDLSVRVEAFFKEEKLIIEGYDVGKSVDEWFGDSDYEYSTTLTGEELENAVPCKQRRQIRIIKGNCRRLQ
jgi:hypothetical protein